MSRSIGVPVAQGSPTRGRPVTRKDQVCRPRACSKNNISMIKVACKRRSSVNSGAWLRSFNDITGIEKSCVAKAKKGQKSEG